MNAAIPGVEVIRLGAGVRRVRVEIEAGEPPAPGEEVERAWREMLRANPRLHNGPVLSVMSIDAATGVIRARRDTYQRLVVQPRVMTGVRQLSVTGVVERDGSVLLGRRGGETRMYPGMWELGPAGGVEPPGPGVRAFGHGALLDELRRESREEAGLEIGGEGAPLAVVFDGLAQSYDVVLRVEALSGPARGEAGWEYQELRWVAWGELRQFERSHSGEIIGPTRALIHALWS